MINQTELVVDQAMRFDKRSFENILGLTSTQEGMLFHYLENPGGDQYVEQLCLDLAGEIQLEFFQRAWDGVIETNEMLRTVFRWEKVEQPLQIVLKEYPLQLLYYDVSDTSPSQAKEKAEAIKINDRKQKFDLRERPFRVTLCKLGKNSFRMIISNHHIIYDGWSSGILLKEFFKNYNDLCKGSPLTKTVKTKFQEFIKWQRNRDSRGEETYWRNYLKGIEHPTVFSIKQKKKEGLSAQTQTRGIVFTDRLTRQLEDFVKVRKLTLASLLYSAWGVLLHRYNNSDDVVFGTTVSGRQAAVRALQEVVGLFINTVPLRVQCPAKLEIIALLYHIHHTLGEREGYESTPLVKIKEYSQLKSSESLFDSLVVIENYPLDRRLNLGNGKILINSYSTREATNYDVTVGITTAAPIAVDIIYDGQICHRETIERLAHHFKNCIEYMIDHVEKEVHEIDLLDEAEKRRLLVDFNDTGPAYLNHKTLPELFKEQAVRTPERVALIGQIPGRPASSGQGLSARAENISITYDEVNKKSGQLAGGLRQKGVGPGGIVGLMVDRSIEMIIALYGILKAGAAYMPVSPDYPAERVRYMLAESGGNWLVTQERYIAALTYAGEIVNIEDPVLYRDPAPGDPVPGRGPGDLVYVIYTSGSTGKPKGVPIKTRGFVSLVHWYLTEFALNRDDRYLLIAPISFDLAQKNLFAPLISGGCLCLSAPGLPDYDRLSEFIGLERLTVINCAPSVFYPFVEVNRADGFIQLTSLRYLFLGGEPIQVEKLGPWFDSGVGGGKVVNTYGPTECTDVVSFYRLDHAAISGQEIIPIGKPVYNVVLYVLDKWRNLLPVGLAGELSIGGTGLSEGYLNNPELTREKFVNYKLQNTNYKQNTKHKLHITNNAVPRGRILNAFGEATTHHSPLTAHHSPIYKTGDLCRWLWDGNLEFLGRSDQQVKVRGIRIELGEIEAQVAKYEGVKEAVVIAREDTREDKRTDNYLCAYIVWHEAGTSDREVLLGGLREHLSARLPDYMIPSYFVTLEQIPLTPSGKLNRRGLPGPEIKAVENQVPPRDPLEEKLAVLWAGVLGLTGTAPGPPGAMAHLAVGIDDNFFERGGHSLKAVTLISRIRKEFHADVTLAELFKNPTIRGLSRYIKGKEEAPFASINPVEKKEYHALSSVQKRLYVLYRLDADSTVYNITTTLLLEGEVDRGSLAGLFSRLIKRHGSLRTSFRLVGEMQVQRVHAGVPFQIDGFEIRETREEPLGQPLSGSRELRAKNCIKDFLRPFDLSRAPLLRVGLIALEPGKQVFVVDMHHIISDGISSGVLVRELMALAGGERLPPLRLRYSDYSDWQNRERQGEVVAKQEHYWKKQFEDEVPVLDLPLDYTRPAAQSFAGSNVTFEIAKGELATLKSLALVEGTTFYMVLLTLYTIFLSKLSNQEDLVVGTPTAGRRHADLEQVVGMFVNTLVLRNFPCGEKRFRSFLREVKERSLQAFDHQDYPYEELVNQVTVTRDPGRNPLFDTMFVLQDTGIPALEIPGLKLSPLEYRDETSKFDLLLVGVEEGDRLMLTMKYSTCLFKPATIRRFIGYFKRVVSAAVRDPAVKLSGIEVVSEEEKQRLLVDFNDTGLVYPQDKTIHELFAGQAEKTPDRLALVGKLQITNYKQMSAPRADLNACGEKGFITYNRLNNDSHGLAQGLKEKGVRPDTIVAIMASPSVEMIIGILGILKAGGAYMPIEPDYPEERQRYMLADSAARIFLSTTDIAEAISTPRVSNRPGAPSPLKGTSFHLHLPPWVNAPATSLAYVLYTSGTTGRPKGVAIEHRSVHNLVMGLRERVYRSYRSPLNVVLLAPVVFDASVKQIFAALLLGHCLHVVPKAVKEDGLSLARYYATQRIQLSDGTPAHLQLLMETGAFTGKWPAHHFLIGGEALSKKVVESFLDRIEKDTEGIYSFKITNVYGPTECTVDSTCFEVTRENLGLLDTIPIGTPLANVRVYIVNPANRLQPLGCAGQLCITGDGIARGYLNRPELTAERFINYKLQNTKYKLQITNNAVPFGRILNAFGEATTHHSPLYQTGDRARWMPDGNIEFLGREDHQVKIRGYRIETGEIENRIRGYEAVKEAMVIPCRSGSGDRYLCAYIVWKKGEEPNRAPVLPGLKEYLAEALPGYMMPSCFVTLEKIPLTANGKLNRELLPGPEPGGESEYAAPRDKIEKKLAETWSAILEVPAPIGIDANFFELGGHSLRAITLISRIHKQFHAKVTLVDIFKKPTIRGLSGYIREKGGDPFASIAPAEEKEYYALSSVQRRLVVLYRLDVFSTVYNMPTAFLSEGAVDKEKLQGLFEQLIRRHESLRTSFDVVKEAQVQRVHARVPFHMEYAASRETQGEPLTHSFPGGLEQRVKRCIKDFIRPFDLSRPPLLRVGLLALEKERQLLLLDLHHIAADGFSSGVLVKELMALAAGYRLPVLRLQYKDYSQWQNSERQRAVFLKQENYWKSQFADEIPVLDLPLDYPRPAVQSFVGSKVTFEIGKEELGALKTVALAQGTTLYMVLLAVYTIFLAKLSNQEDIVVGTPTAGRRHADLEQVVGMFVNTLALRNYPVGEKTFAVFLREAAARSLQAFDHQDYPYEELVNQVTVTRDTSRNPLFDTMFVLQNTGIPALEIPGSKLSPVECRGDTSKFDLLLVGVEEGEGLLLTLEYAAPLFKPATIDRFIDYFKRVVSFAARDPEVKLSGIEIIPGEEKQRLLFAFNGPGVEYPEEKTLHELFAAQAEKTPDRPALVGKLQITNYKQIGAPRADLNACDRKGFITYNRLNNDSHRLAQGLKEKGVRPDTIVAIMASPSVEMITGILGILKAGGAYMPIDPDYPEERQRYMLADSAARIFLSTTDIAAVISTPRVSNRPGAPSPLKGTSFHLHLPPWVNAPATSLAYVLYTSGTTGRPKGVTIEHRSVHNLVMGLKEKVYRSYHRPLNVALLAPVVFDASVQQIFAALLLGHCLHVVAKAVKQDGILLVRYYETRWIQLSDGTPAHMQMLMETGAITGKCPVVHFLIGGEALAKKTVESFRDHLGKGTAGKYSLRITNVYGPTECTVDSTCFEVTRRNAGLWDTIPIGAPLANVRVYIVNRAYRLQPLGCAGQLCITGDGIARGYLNRPELTSERFINYKLQNTKYKLQITNNAVPFGRILNAFGEATTRHSPLYQTGDRARWMPDGNIEFLGREDHQVKIRGYRIETGEIENRIRGYEAVKEAVVIPCRSSSGDQYLCAYIVWRKSGEPDRAVALPGLKEHLADALPGYMIPSCFVTLEKIPLTASGKLNRELLPGPEPGGESEYAAPRDKIEKKLAETWSAILEVPAPIGIDDNFFELGGHSLRAITLISRVRKQFHARVTLAEIFKKPTIRGLSGYIREKEAELFLALEPVEEKEYYALSSVQKRLMVLYRLDVNSTVYNIPTVLLLEGAVDKGHLERLFGELLKRHESLRTWFDVVKEVQVQRIHARVPFHMEYAASRETGEEPLTHPFPKGIGRRAGSCIKEFIRPFDLSRAPLLRVGLLELAAEKHLLMVDMYHIISDGISCGVLVRELLALAAGKKLPIPRLQYKDYSEWQNSERQRQVFLKQEHYWTRQFADEIPVLDLPLDYPRPEVQSFAGSRATFEIGNRELQGLKSLALAEGTTLYMVLLTLYTIFIAKLSNQEDIVVGTPTAGRRHADLEPLIGMFVNTLALRNYPVGEKTVRVFLREVKERSLQAFDHQDYPYEELVNQVTVTRDTSRNPLFDTMFVLQNTGIPALEIPGLKLSPVAYRGETSKFDLLLVGVEEGERLLLTMEYAASLFKPVTIDRFMDYFKRVVSTVVGNPAVKLSELELVSEKEKQRLLVDFNDTGVDYPDDRTIYKLFARQVERAADRVALVGPKLPFPNYQKEGSPIPLGDNLFITYNRLKKRADQLAEVLRHKGMRPDRLAAIMVEPSLEMIIAVLGVLKTGGGYLPIDPQQGKERVTYMLKDSQAPVLLTSGGLANTLDLKGESQAILLDDFPVYRGDGANSQWISSPGDVVYTIYTSGTSGNPKGTLIENRNLVNYVQWFRDRVNLTGEDRTVLTSSFGFDLGYTLVYSSLLSGGRLHIIGSEVYLSPEDLTGYILRHQVTYIKVTPSFFSTIVESPGFSEEVFRSVRLVLLGGENIKLKDVERAHAIRPNMAVMNHYGPTEATIGCVAQMIDFHHFDDYKERPAIGSPVANMRVFILDQGLNLVPPGVAGELCVSGAGVARGYLNQPELTADKFDHDFLDHQDYHDKQCNKKLLRGGQGGGFLEKSPPGRRRQKVYRTGDLARWLSHGAIEFLGRIDTQVKIRGYRIETGEIENRIRRHETVKEAVVITGRYTSGETYLCAYIVRKRGVEPDRAVAGLKEYLADVLPEYMIPSYFVTVEKIPLTANGKLNRKLLPEPGRRAESVYAAPRDKIEKKLTETWSAILEVPAPIGIDDNFFELGGHSLRAITLISRVRKQFHADVTLAEIFKKPTIRGLSGYIREKEAERFVSIEPAEEKEYYALSSAQKRLVVLYRLDANSTVYNIPTVLLLEGAVDKGQLERLFWELLKRHESLRTSFDVVKEVQVQRIHARVPFHMEYVGGHETGEEPLTHPFPKSLERRAGSGIKEFIRPFDLSRAPLLRAGLLELAAEKHLLMVDMYHIISDGISRGVLVRELMALAAGKKLPTLRLQYKDYSEWQTSERRKQVFLKQEHYWTRQFEDEIPVLNLPLDYTRPEVQSFAGSKETFEISQGEAEALKTLALAEGATLYMVLLALYNVFLSKLGDQEDIVVGTPTAGRRHTDLEPLIGMFVNTLVLRNFPWGEKTFPVFLTEVKENSLQAFENQDYPYENLVHRLLTTRDTSRNPLFDTMFVLQNAEIPMLEIPGLKLSPIEYREDTSKFDLLLVGVEEGDRLLLTMEYNTRLFKPVTIRRFVDWFKRIVSAAVENPRAKLSDLEMISGEEKQRILLDFNDIGVEFPGDKTIQELFAEQVERTPDRVALIGQGLSAGGENISITYDELNNKANHLAGVLREKGVGPGDIVGLMVNRSMEMMTGLYGILKAGGAYMPVSPDYPAERVRYMLAEGGSHWLVTQEKYILSIVFAGEIVNVEDPALYREPAIGNPVQDSSPGDLVYVIYTSGSTGKPKGVPIKTRGFVSLVHWYLTEFDLNGDDRYLLIAPTSFDLAQKNLFAPLISGGCLCLSAPGLPDYDRLSELIALEYLTVINCAPSVFYPFVEVNRDNGFFKLASLRFVFLGGESIQVEKLVSWWDSGVCAGTVVNTYGPTECTDVVSFYRLDPGVIGGQERETIPIGKPVYNVILYVLDKGRKLLPVGLAGELSIGGIGLSAGYLNNPELTCERFDQYFWDSQDDHDKKLLRGVQGGGFLEKNPPGRRRQKFYKTGDLCRWLGDGNLEFLGRSDQQVKIRGLRIELGEIEAHIVKYEGVKEAVVIAREDKRTDNYLCAYIVWHEAGKPDREVLLGGLNEHLSARLPDYMIPSYFVTLEQIPLTPSGKLNRRVLPGPEIKAAETRVRPRNPLEEKLAVLWAEVLDPAYGEPGLPGSIAHLAVGIDDNFFERGGHSLKAVTLISRIRKQFHVDVMLAELFKNPTIRGLSSYIKGKEEAPFASINPVEKKEYYALSSIQKRLYVLHRLDADSTVYNIPTTLLWEGEIDRARLAKLFSRLIKRHESLRTSMPLMGEMQVQRVHAEVPFQIDYFESGATPELRAQSCIKDFLRPFDLSRAPLLRVGLMALEPGKHIFVVDMHHIISDGISCGVLVRELMALAGGERLLPLRLQYKDYSEWQNSERRREVFHKQAHYWMKQFEAEVPVLDLPVDYPRPAVRSFAGSKVTFEISQGEAKVLKSLALAEGTTLYMVLLTLYTIFLAKLSNQEDLVVGTPTAGRGHADLESLIGMFVNTLALRNYPVGEKTVTVLLREVKARALQAFDHQDYPFAELVSQAALTRDTGRNPLFDTMFVLQEIGIPRLEIPGLKLGPFEYRDETAKFDLLLVGVEEDDRLLLTMEYSTCLFKPATMQRFIAYFKRVVSTVVGDPAVKLSGIGLLSAEEKQQILFDFNDTRVDYPADETIHALFARQVEQTPDRVALVGVKVQLSYRQLHGQAQGLAIGLQGKGVGADTLVALVVDRSVEMITGILGILEAGGAYLPIDPDYPPERVQYMLTDSAATLLLNTTAIAEAISTPRVSNGPAAPSPLEGTSFHPHLPPAPATSLAYVIYTSGTTGKPKGTLTSHRNVIRVVRSTNYIDIGAGDRLLQLSNYAFDGSVFDIYGALLNGAALVMIEKESVLSVERLSRVIIAEAVTVFFVTTALFNTLVDLDLRGLRHTRKVLFGGERVSVEHVGKALEFLNKQRIIHVYGPTETTVYATYYPIDRRVEGRETIPIGFPLANTTAYILDKAGGLQPLGVTGELFIGGAGVARGYLNQPELTAEKFDREMLLRGVQGGGFLEKSPPGRRRQKIYRTGDLARWWAGGSIEFIGRLDHQVKIRGFRVELGEIEYHLLRRERVKECVVLARKTPAGETYLCAYIVSSGDAGVLSDQDYRDSLSRGLPGYMIPSSFVRLDRFPLTPSGKIDTKALPDPGLAAVGLEAPGPRDAVEEKLTVLWSELFKVPVSQLSIDTDFFAAGGHSLTVLRLANALKKEFQVQIVFQDLFRFTTIRELARLVRGKEITRQSAIEPREHREYYELSYTQKRLWLLYQLDPGNPAFNLPVHFTLYEPVAVGVIHRVLETLVQRHESFRTYFREIEGEPVQILSSHAAVEVAVVDCSGFSGREREQARESHLWRERVQSFRLEEPPLFRARLIKCGEEEFDILLTQHHIITDGWSLEVLKREFFLLYDAYKTGSEYEFPLPRVGYKDYVSWHNGLLSDRENMRGAREFWQAQLKGDAPVLNLPYDFPGENLESKKSAGYRLVIPETVVQALQAVAQQCKASLFMVLLAGFNLLLWRVTGQSDVILAVPGAARQHEDLKHISGLFVNTLILRNRVDAGEPFVLFLERVQQTMLQVLEYQDYPLELICGEFKIKYPEIDVFFNMSLFGDTGGGNRKGGSGSRHIERVQDAKFAVVSYLGEYQNRVTIETHYYRELFKPVTIEKIMRLYAVILEHIGKEPEKKIGAYSYTLSGEKRKLKLAR